MSKSYAFCFVLFTYCSAVHDAPSTPCPELFNYSESRTFEETVGVVTLQNDLSGLYDLEVNMSIATNTYKNMHITRATEVHKIQNGEGIEYHVHFPYNHTFPKLTSITFNGKLYCVGPPEEKTADHGVTPLSARHFFITKIVDSVKVLSTPKTFVQIVVKNSFENHPECGTKIHYKPLIFSGSSTQSGEYPWLVAIFTAYDIGSYNFICGGSLISTKHVMTAAHCMRDFGTSRPVKDLVIVLGKHNIQNWVRGSTIRGIKDYYVHPDYEKPSDADMALLLLDKPVTFSPTIKPICLWDEDDDLVGIVNKTGNVAGWGVDESGKNYLDEPKQIELPIVSQEMCLRADRSFLEYTSTRTFCAGNLGESRGPCTGDSGGGFVMNRGGTWKLRGIVSLALLDQETRMCDINKYTVFTDVPKYTTWIHKIMDTL